MCMHKECIDMHVYISVYTFAHTCMHKRGYVCMRARFVRVLSCIRAHVLYICTYMYVCKVHVYLTCARVQCMLMSANNLCTF